MRTKPGLATATLSLFLLAACAGPSPGEMGCLQETGRGPDAACIAPSWRDEARPLGKAWESATYELLDGEGRSLGRSILNVSLNSPHVEVEVSFNLTDWLLGQDVPGTQMTASLQFDSSSGVLLDVRDVGASTRPWGVRKVMPQLHDALLGPPGLRFAPLVAPVGPQWALLVENPPIGPTPWGEAIVQVATTSEGWRVWMEAPCQDSCGLETPNQTTYLAFEGDATELLPGRAEIGFTSIPVKLVLNRLLHSHSSMEVSLGGDAPLVDAFPLPPAPCGMAPCEGASWPDAFSLQEGWKALEQSPQWVLFFASHPEAFPLSMAVGSGRIDLAGVGLLDQQVWGFIMGASTASSAFSLQRVEKDPAGSSPVVVTSSTQGDAPNQTFYGNQAWGEPVLSPDEALRLGLDELGVSYDDLTSVHFAYRSLRFSPDPRAHLVWAAFVEDAAGAQGSVVSSGYSGEILELRFLSPDNLSLMEASF